MKVNIKYTFFIFLTIVLSSCSMDDSLINDPMIYTEPVFKISGSLNQNPLDIQAGEQDFYMYTDFEIDTSNVPTFIGRFAAEAGKTIEGDEELTFYIRGNAAIPSGSPISINEILTEGSLAYSSPISYQTSSYRYDFNSTALTSAGIGSIDNFLWEFPNGETSTEANPSITLNSDAKFSAKLSASNSNGANSDYIGLVSPSINSDSTLLLKLNYEIITNNEVMITVENQGLDLTWSTGETTDTIFYDSLNIDGELITVTASNSYGDIALASLFVRQEPLGFPLAVEVFTTSFNYEVAGILTQSLDLETVVIEYKKDGMTYSSNLDEQGQNNFSINLIEGFQDNENGFPTKKLQIAFECLLFNDAGESIPFSGDGYIGVAYTN